MTMCVFNQSNKVNGKPTVRCACGNWMYSDGTGKYYAVCKAKARKSKQLGDRTEQLLKSIGITEDKYKAVKKMFGLAPTCGCSKRKEWLNKVSSYFLS